MSPLHRLGAGTKLAGLCVCSIALLAVRSPAGVGAAVVGVLVLYALARLGPRALWSQVRPLRWFVPCVVAVQWATLGPLAAAVLTTRLVVLVALAGLVTLTTPTSLLLAALERALRPLGRVGVDAERAALVLALAVRSVPVLTALVGSVRDAQRARGREHDVRALAVPLVVGALRQADALGEALRARGLDDEGPSGEPDGAVPEPMEEPSSPRHGHGGRSARLLPGGVSRARLRAGPAWRRSR